MRVCVCGSIDFGCNYCHVQRVFGGYVGPPTGMSLTETLDAINASSIPSSWRKALSYKAVEMLTVPPPQQGSTRRVLSDFEDLMADAKDNGITGVAELTTQLHKKGFSSLANRVRALAR